MSAKTPTAYWPTPSLIRSLSRAGWGVLGGHSMKGVRATLRALVDHLSDKSGTGTATRWQLAHAAGQSTKWTGHCLNLLEDMGLIRWTRGGIVDGKPAPSFFEIVKTKLVELIRAARPESDKARAEHAKETSERLAGLRPGVRVFKGRRSRRSHHGELSANLRPPNGGTSTGGTPVRGIVSDDWSAKRAHYLQNAAKREALADERAARRVQARVSALIDDGVSEEMAYLAYLKLTFGARVGNKS